MKVFSLFRKSLFFCSFFLLVMGVISYWPVLSSINVINPDAQFILPSLSLISSVKEYFVELLSFKTLDFQPLRDLSFFFDLKIFSFLGIDVTVIHNLAWWLGGNWFLSKLICNIFPESKKESIFLIVLGFLVYPLFSQTIPWGVARKHLLSFFFSMLLTERWTRERSRFLISDVFFYSFFYACSVLSQPIAILWPLWALLYLALIKPSLLKSSVKVFFSLGVILLVLGLVNYFYYTNSSVFLSIYAQKTNEAFEFSDKVLAIGHYTFQLVFPYLLSFNYTLGHYSTLIGLVILVLLSLLLRASKAPLKEVIVWIVFFILPLLVVMTNSKILYDTYLLIPSVGFLFLLLILSRKVPRFSQNVKFLSLGLLILFWVFTTNKNASLWRDELSLAEESFQNRPSCLTAATYLRISYEQERKGPTLAKNFFGNFVCSEKYEGKMLINLYTYMFFYEVDLSIQERVKRLKMMSPLNFFSHATLVSFYIREKMLNEAQLEILEFKRRWKGMKIAPEYIPIIAKYINPYCKQTEDQGCIELIKPFSTQNKKLNLMIQ